MAIGSTSPDGFWRFRSIPSRLLIPGNYVIAATVTDIDLVRVELGAPLPITTIPGLSYIEPRFLYTAILEYPPGHEAFPLDAFGPNLHLGVANGVNAPALAPIATGILVAILGAIGAARLRSRKA